MANEVKWGNLPFQEAVDHFREKLSLPTESYRDLRGAGNARAFVVAGANKAALVTDLHAAVDDAIAGGDSIGTFRKKFDAIVEKHGWDYRGGRNWRTEVIYTTNVRQAYNAGRWKQMTDPEVVRLRPYLQYHHSGSPNPREQHLAWDGLTLEVNDPWWHAHAPQNGYGCKCTITSVSRRDLARMGKPGPDQAPPIQYVTHVDRLTGEELRVPAGIDPGFDYNPGIAAWGKQGGKYAAAVEASKKWEELPGKDWRQLERPERIPLDLPKARPGKRMEPGGDMVERLREVLGGEEQVFILAGDHKKAPDVRFKQPKGVEGDTQVTVPMSWLDKAWQKDPLLYIGPGGSDNAIEGRYAGFKKFLETGEPVEMPRVSYDPEMKKINFTNGRHRTAALRDMGVGRIPVMVSNESAQSLREAIRQVRPPPSNEFRYPVRVNAEVLGGHLKEDRAPFLPLIAETIQDPFEVWASFVRSNATGKVELRLNLIKAIQEKTKSKGMVFAVNLIRGELGGWTFFPVGDLSAINRIRKGMLIFGRSELEGLATAS